MAQCVWPEPLTAPQLKRLEEHKYSSSGRSMFEPPLQIYWNWLVEQIPTWVAPNTLTIIGLIINVATTLILMCYCPSAREEFLAVQRTVGLDTIVSHLARSVYYLANMEPIPMEDIALLSAPGWAFLLSAFGLFIYQSLDAIDGKQARRTNSSSPLGELFDHGCDAVSTGTCIAVRMGTDSNWMFFCGFIGMFMFYCAHWQTYVSGTLRFGLIDVTEVQVSITIMYLMTAFGGTGLWDYRLPVLGWKLQTFPLLGIIGGALFSCSNYFQVILSGGVGKNGSTVADTSVLSPGTHIGLILTMAVMIFKKSSSQLFENHSCLYILTFGCVFAKIANKLVDTSVLSPGTHIGLILTMAVMIFKKSSSQLFENHSCLYILTFGCVFAKIANKLVVAHMAKSELHLQDTAFIGPGLLFLNQYFNSFIDEYFVLWIAMTSLYPNIHKQIIEGKDVNLVSILIAMSEFLDYRVVDCGDLSVTLKSHDPHLGEFVLAFSIYRDVLSSTYPHRQLELDQCLFYIMELSIRYGGTMFYEYHKAFSAKAASILSADNHIVDGSSPDLDLFNRIFNGL
ncbi:UNVERIFIED_CONTAM: hypothetical protein FKN15_020296 [Acipenser sinensis]